jgi:pimeloyl-ACP methyl ester carboxylesterase
MNEVLYLHGFASGPGSSKALFLARRWEALGIRLQVPDLNAPSFERLSVSSQLRVLEGALDGRPAMLVGSSLGGYLAALYASLHPEVERVVLLAPAFGFARRWAERIGQEAFASWRAEGAMDVFHYGLGRNARLGFQLIEDALTYPDVPEVVQPCLVLHGRADEMVPIASSREFARRANVTLLELADDHELRGDLDGVARTIEGFLRLC